MVMKHISLKIKSRLENTDMVGKSIYAICNLAGMTPSDTVRVELCVVEAVTNCIKHAYKNKQESDNSTVRIEITLTDEDLLVKVLDKGTPMPMGLLEAARNPPPFDPENIEALTTNGRGLILITEIMDDVDYLEEDGWNCLVMRKKL